MICAQGVAPVRVRDGAAVVIHRQRVDCARVGDGAAVVVCSQDVVPCHVGRVVSCRVLSRHVTSCHVTPRRAGPGADKHCCKSCRLFREVGEFRIFAVQQVVQDRVLQLGLLRCWKQFSKLRDRSADHVPDSQTEQPGVRDSVPCREARGHVTA